MSKEEMKWDYNGHEITINKGGVFKVASIDAYACHESLAKAKEAIDKHVKTMEASTREKLTIDALDAKDGSSFRIIGVHAGHGKLLTTPKKERDFMSSFVVDCQPARELIDRKLALMKALTQTEKELDKFEIKELHRKYGVPLDHAAAVKHVKDQAKAALAYAKNSATKNATSTE